MSTNTGAENTSYIPNTASVLFVSRLWIAFARNLIALVILLQIAVITKHRTKDGGESGQDLSNRRKPEHRLRELEYIAQKHEEKLGTHRVFALIDGPEDKYVYF